MSAPSARSTSTEAALSISSAVARATWKATSREKANEVSVSRSAQGMVMSTKKSSFSEMAESAVEIAAVGVAVPEEL